MSGDLQKINNYRIVHKKYLRTIFVVKLIFEATQPSNTLAIGGLLARNTIILIF